MSPEEAARRRDFTINAILYDPLLDEIMTRQAASTTLITASSGLSPRILSSKTV